MYETITLHDATNLANINGVDSLCGHYNYCELGVLYASPFPYFNTVPVNTCTLDELYKPSSNIFNWEYLQRLYEFGKSYYLLDVVQLTTELCVSPCQIQSICVNNNNFRDIVKLC
jgi:hypothetical protein